MPTILEQDAADALEAYERDQAFRAAVRERWAKAQPAPIVSTWKPVLTEQEQLERERDIKEHQLPF